MKKLKIITTVIVCALGLSGCLVKSINPFYTQDIVIETPKEIEGKWRTIKSRGEDIPSKESIDVEVKGHQLILKQSGKIPVFLEVNIFKVEAQEYMDYTLNVSRHKLEEFNDYMKLTHGIFKVEQVKEGLALTPLNQKWLTEFFNTNPSMGSIEGNCGDYCEIMLTASSVELVKVFQNLKGNDLAFPLTDKIILKRM